MIRENKFERYHENKVRLKAMVALKYYVFKFRMEKVAKKYRSLRIWSKNLKFKSFAALKVYLNFKKEKKSVYAKAF